MATVDWQILAAGLVSNVQGAIFTAAEQSWVKLAIFTQGSATPQDLKVYLKKAAGTAREVGRADDMPEGYKLVLDEQIAMGAGDSLEAVTTTDAVVAFSVTGGVRVP